MAWRVYSMLALVVLGCQLPNPAFDSEGGDESEASTDKPVDTESTTEAPLDTSDTSDPDTTETGEDPICELETRPALRLVYRTGDGSCPPVLNEVALRLDVATLNAEPGVATGLKCDDFGCASCPYAGYAIGAPGFEGLAQTWTALAEVAAPENIEGLCVEATATTLVGMADGACIYEAMGIYDNTIEHGPIFIGQINEAPATWVATSVLGQELPTRSVAPIASCSCTDLFSPNDEAVTCCEGVNVEPSVYSLVLRGLELAPGESDTLMIEMIEWVFHVRQAQTVATCDNLTGKEERSWALTRVE